MTTAAPVRIQLSRQFDAAPERVFDAFLDPTRAGKFLYHKSNAQMMLTEIDARVGGRFTFVDRRDGNDVAFVGQYLEIERPRRLVFKLTVEKFDLFDDYVLIEIAPKDKGCMLTVTHEASAHLAPFKADIERGWTDIFDLLPSALK